jgi:hypothetical protein
MRQPTTTSRQFTTSRQNCRPDTRNEWSEEKQVRVTDRWLVLRVDSYLNKEQALLWDI